MKGIKAGLTAILSMLLVWGLCACDSSYVTINSPLQEPHIIEGILLSYDKSDPLHDNSEFIFKGRIDRISEICFNYQHIGSDNKSIAVESWRSICEVSIENVLFGAVQDVKDKIKVVFQASSRRKIQTTFDLIEGQEYYFLTHIYTETDKARISKDVKEYEYGSVLGGNTYHLLPVSDGIVTFREGWPFVGAKHPVVTNDNWDTLEGVACTIDEKSFLEQFIPMIQAAKSTTVPEPTAP
jgi:hypothetical protein